MSENTYRALVVREMPDGSFMRRVETCRQDDLPDGDVLIRGAYSSLNYKDALSASGNRGVTRNYPHVPGIDAVGEVLESRSESVVPGDWVIVAAAEFGVSHSGGFSQLARVPAEWTLPLPAGLSPFESMVYGVAGFTAAQCVLALQEGGVTSEWGEVLVTGATGGVGSIAVALLAKEGYDVVAATGKMDQADFLKRLGASTVIHRDEILDPNGKPLLSGRWGGVVDTVGGSYLATAIKSTRHGGVIAACGNAAGAELHTTVFPFILRGVRLVGIETAQTPMAVRRAVWEKLAGEWKLPMLNSLARPVSLNDLSAEIDRILRGEQVGRVVVDLQ